MYVTNAEFLVGFKNDLKSHILFSSSGNVSLFFNFPTSLRCIAGTNGYSFHIRVFTMFGDICLFPDLLVVEF